MGSLGDKGAAELLQIATTIAKNGHRVGEIHRLLDNYAQNGSQPVNEKAAMLLPVEEMSRGNLARTLINLPPTITKARKKMATLPPESADYKLLEQNIAIWSQQLTLARQIAKEP